MKKTFPLITVIKKMVPLLLLSVFLLPMAARAEIKAGSVELSPFAGYNFFESRQNLKDRPVFGGRLGYNFTDHFGIEAAGAFTKSRVDDSSKPMNREGEFTSPIDGVKITTYHLDLLYHFMTEGKFNPFITAGYGAINYSPKINNKNMSAVDFGVGAKYWLCDNFALRVDVRDNLIVDEQISNIEATFGIVFAFGGKKHEAAVVSNAPRASNTVEISDTTAPTVTFTAPDNGATAVPVNHKVNAAFSKEMDTKTLDVTTFAVKKGREPVAGTVTSEASTATFAPAHDFEKGTLYTATVSTGARDTAGNALANNYMWEFTTGLAADTTAPTVVFTSPVNGATAAPVKQRINVAFSKAMDPATLTASTFTVKQGSVPVAGKVTSVGSNATFASAKDLEKGKSYTATVTTGAKDMAGNALPGIYVWNFTAFATPKVVAVLATLQNSHFDYNSAVISENGKTILNNNTKTMKTDPKMKILVSGYTSASGTPEYNQKLSERRAVAVKDYLVKTGGIDGNRITTIGYGEAHPAVYEAVPADKLSAAALANMRVLVEVVEE